MKKRINYLLWYYLLVYCMKYLEVDLALSGFRHSVNRWLRALKRRTRILIALGIYKFPKYHDPNSAHIFKVVYPIGRN